MSRSTRAAAALAAGAALISTAASAHVVVGNRVFPVTLTFDDPGVGDEFTMPQITWERSAGPQELTRLQWEYDKTITPNTAFIYNQGYDWLTQPNAKTKTGFENAVITGKWQAYVNPEHEFIASLGVAYEFNGSQATQSIGGDAYGSITPIAYFGKGLGDLPIGMLRPLAVTGEFTYAFPMRRLNAAADNSGTPHSVTGGLSLQYSIPYLQSQVKDLGLPPILARLIPLVEATWFSPAGGPASGFPSTLKFGVGAIYLSDTFQVGIEALIPGNKAAGPSVGFTVQFHVFLDDLMPNTLGRPIFR